MSDYIRWSIYRKTNRIGIEAHVITTTKAEVQVLCIKRYGADVIVRKYRGPQENPRVRGEVRP